MRRRAGISIILPEGGRRNAYQERCYPQAARGGPGGDHDPRPEKVGQEIIRGTVYVTPEFGWNSGIRYPNTQSLNSAPRDIPRTTIDAF